MSHRSAMMGAIQAATAIIGGVAIALAVGTAPTGCGSSSNNGTAGSGGSTGDAGTTGAAGSTGDAGTGGGAAGTGGGAAGTGGAPACGSQVIQVSADITTDTTWSCNTYVLTQKIHIDGGASVATLTIAPGSKIYGAGSPSSPAALISTRNGRLVAVGTPTAPITFSSSAQVGSRAPGDTFAGVVMLGRGVLNSGTCVDGTGACAAPGYFQRVIEGLDATDPKGQYGGTDNSWNCGDLRYVRIQFGGYIIGANNELNGLTLGGCGTATRLSYIHIHRGLDDGIEFFGGAAGADHVLVSGVDDDGIDWDFGWSGKVQFLIVHQAYGTGDKGFESDNFTTTQTITPRSSPEIWNATMIAETGNSKIGMHLRTGTWYKLRNFIVHGFGSTTTATLASGAINVDSSMMENDPKADWPTNMSIENSVFFGGPLAPTEDPAMVDGTGACPTTTATAPAVANNDFCFNEAAALMDPARMNTTTADPMFAAGFNQRVIATTPSYVPGNAAAVSSKATPPAPFDTTANYAGAVAPGTAAGAAWYDGWTEFPEK